MTGISIAFDQLMQKLIFLTLTLIAILSTTPVFGKNACTPEQDTKISGAVEMAKYGTIGMLKELEGLMESKQYPQEHEEGLKIARETMQCILHKILRRPKFECLSPKSVDFNSSTPLAELSDFRIPSLDLFTTIKLYNLAIQFPKEYLASTITHEISHLCYTKDHDYFFKLIRDEDALIYIFNYEKFNNSKDKEWYLNADHYAFWTVLGFCIPHFNCDTTMSPAFLFRTLNGQSDLIMPRYMDR